MKTIVNAKSASWLCQPCDFIARKCDEIADFSPATGKKGDCWFAGTNTAKKPSLWWQHLNLACLPIPSQALIYFSGTQALGWNGKTFTEEPSRRRFNSLPFLLGEGIRGGAYCLIRVYKNRSPVLNVVKVKTIVNAKSASWLCQPCDFIVRKCDEIADFFARYGKEGWLLICRKEYS